MWRTLKPPKHACHLGSTNRLRVMGMLDKTNQAFGPLLHFIDYEKYAQLYGESQFIFTPPCKGVPKGYQEFRL